MPILELPPNPSRSPNRTNETAGDPTPDPADGRARPVKVRTGRFGELEEHELIHLIDSLDDERSRARFRESIYISIIIWLAIGWFLFYGPRVLFHQPVLRDPIAMMKQHDLETNLIAPHTPALKAPPKIDTKTMERLQKQAREAPPTPQPQAQQPPPPPQEEAHNTAPPVAQPAMPLPATPKSAAPSVELPAAPKPNFAQNSQSAHSAMQDAMKGARGHSGAEVNGPGAGGPLQAGAQILSDIGDWDPSAYMRRLKSDIQRNWDPLIPEEVQAPLMKKGIVGIRFSILPDGSIENPMILETTSGDVALDKAAWSAITSEGQFPPLPKEFHGQQLELRIGFFYNTPIQQ